MKHNLIYTFINKETLIPFPYPPLYQENDTDYICFTNNKTITSKFWKIHYSPILDKSVLNNIIFSYENYYEIQSNQILIDSIFQNHPNQETLITIPDLHDIPEVSFNETAIIPTKDNCGNYLYQKNPIYTNGPYHGRPLLLSIAVPVSNQIDTIERCLSHIKPILDQLDAELIVINTGSTDGTLEICNHYGARIINFPWCNNMSAARNIGIYHAVGDWYLSIDDDEWFENVDEIITFFKTGMYKNYSSATYIQRNYETSSGETWSDLPALRVAKVTPELHFEGRIHDALITKDEKPYQLSAYVHHYGFRKDNSDKKLAKYIRNVSYLLYDVYEYPDHLRYNYQLAKELNISHYYKEACAYFIRGMSIEKEKKDNYYGKNHAVHLLATLYNIRDTKLFQMAKLIETSYPSMTPAEKAFIHYLQLDFGLRTDKSPEQLLKHYYQYQNYYFQFSKNPNHSFLYSDIGLKVCTNPSYIADASVIAFYAYNQLKDISHTLDILNVIIPEHIMFMKTTFIHALLAADDKIYNTGFSKLSYPQIRLWASELLYHFLISLKPIETQTRQFSRLSLFLKDLNVDIINNFLISYKNKIDIEIQNILCKNAMDLKETTISSQELFFYVHFLRYRYKNASENTINITFFIKYCRFIGTFTSIYYQPDLLKQTTCSILPKDILATYYIYLFLQEKESLYSDHYLNIALSLFPKFKTEIQILLKET